MSLRDALCLSHGEKTIRLFPLEESSLEIGSHPECDVVIHDDRVPARALLVQPWGGTAYAYDLAKHPGLGARSLLPIGAAVPLGGEYAVTRLKTNSPPPPKGATQLLRQGIWQPYRLSLVAGRRSEAKAHHIGDYPLSIGGAVDNVIALCDRAVSRYHCRVEPFDRGAFVRDLGSTNGTWVDGVRVQRQPLRPGAILRLGRTELRIVCRGVSTGSEPVTVLVSGAMCSVMADVDRFARLPWPVLIQGETGVGKEHVARALHDRGPRSGGPFVALNAGGLTQELVESELFGHSRGAFTGAVHAHRGAFEQADGGTLFLDEVAELPTNLQTRLLRVLETWQVRRVGSEAERGVDVRLVCATHRDIRAMARDDRFRSDLYYRIHRLVLDVPPLRARVDDIAPLAEHFLGQMRSEIGPRALEPEALGRLRSYPWPGNVRELRNVLEHAAAHCDGPSIGLSVIERTLQRISDSLVCRPSVDSLRATLEHYDGNVSAAARALGIPRSTLRDRLKNE
jgi:transcriptional regulator with AAA-type ATPase domain